MPRNASRLLVGSAGLLLGLLGAASPALGTSLPLRTLVVSSAPDGTPANGPSSVPVLSASGRVLAFSSTATNLGPDDANGATRDVYTVDLATNGRRLVSLGLGDGGADGPSYDPAITGDGERVAFASDATNLVPGDSNGATDVFVRDGDGTIARVSTAEDGTQANGRSYAPDISEDGRYVVFTSDASNLVPGDTNGASDVFVRDLSTGALRRVSVGPGGRQAAGRSMAPAISADGRTVSFASGAANLVAHDSNHVMDVFVRDLSHERTERVSVSSSGHQQDRSVTPPFVQISSVSATGRYVAFDTDATDLYAQDINRHTDVYLRDRRRGTTRLVSASSTNVQGNNDSFAPRLTMNARFLSFESFATNLAPGGGPREDIFLRDLAQQTTSVVNVTAGGQPRGPEQVPQLLQRPAVSQDGSFAAFSSTVTNLVPGDTNGVEDVFVRLLDPPSAHIAAHPSPGRAGTVTVSADDPAARTNVCRFDSGRPFICGDRIRVGPRDGRVLTIRAGGVGMRYSSELLRVRLRR